MRPRSPRNSSAQTRHTFAAGVEHLPVTLPQVGGCDFAFTPDVGGLSIWFRLGRSSHCIVEKVPAGWQLRVIEAGVTVVTREIDSRLAERLLSARIANKATAAPTVAGPLEGLMPLRQLG